MANDIQSELPRTLRTLTIATIVLYVVVAVAAWTDSANRREALKQVTTSTHAAVGSFLARQSEQVDATQTELAEVKERLKQSEARNRLLVAALEEQGIELPPIVVDPPTLTEPPTVPTITPTPDPSETPDVPVPSPSPSVCLPLVGCVP